MIKSINKKPIKTHSIDIGSFSFYENFVIGEVKEGKDLNFESGAKLYELFEIYYKGKTPFVYISNRINSYSFKPTRLYGSEKYFPNLKGYCIVTYDAINTKVAKLEQTFTSMPTSVFKNIDTAIDWAKNIILTS